MRSLPLPLALTARLAPVAVLAVAGWALSSGPLAAAPDTGPRSSGAAAPQVPSGSAPSADTEVKAYTASPAPCTAIAGKTVKSLVPGAKTSGKEIKSTDAELRRTCSWNALKGYDYRWLDISFEVTSSEEKAKSGYDEHVSENGGGGKVPGLGDEAYSVVNLVKEDGQQTREGMVVVRASNALMVVTYNGSDFESKKAPGTDEINKGAIKAAKDAVAALRS